MPEERLKIVDNMGYLTIAREMNAQRINEIVNDPSIYPWIKGHQTGPFDLTPVVENKDNVILIGEHGGIIFIKLQAGRYECHTNILPQGRGNWVKEWGPKAFAWMFCNTDAVEILTKCPQNNLMARLAAAQAGFIKDFTTRAIWPCDQGIVPIDVYSFPIEKWVKDAPDLVDQGKIFHAYLDAQYTILEKEIEVHENDDTHNRYVGACVAMIRGKMIWKAINFYNRWAVMSGYQPIAVISDDPLIIDISESKLKITPDSFEVI